LNSHDRKVVEKISQDYLKGPKGRQFCMNTMGITGHELSALQASRMFLRRSDPRPDGRGYSMMALRASRMFLRRSGPRPDGRGYVRLKARVVGEVKVLFRQTLSGL